MRILLEKTANWPRGSGEQGEEIIVKDTNHLKTVAEDQIYGHNRFSDVWQDEETLEVAIGNIIDFFESEPDQEFEADYGLIAEILLDGAKYLFVENGDMPATEHQLQALLDDGRINAFELGEYMSDWRADVWGGQFEAKYRIAD